MKHFRGLEERKVSSLRTHLLSEVEEGGGVWEDGSHSGHKGRGWLLAGHNLCVWHKHSGISWGPQGECCLLFQLTSLSTSLGSLGPPSFAWGTCAILCINPSHHSAIRRLYPFCSPQILFQVGSAVLLSWEHTVQISQGESSTTSQWVKGENQFKSA